MPSLWPPNLWILAVGFLLASWTLGPAFPHSLWARRLCPWLRLTGLGLCGLALGGPVGAVLLIALWLGMPWLELSTRVRGIRLPEEISMTHRLPPGPDHFPDLRARSREIEQHGFERAADLGWESESQKQFLRLFLDDTGTRVAALHCVQQEALSFAFTSVTQVLREASGPEAMVRSWTSPLPSGLSLPPGQHLNRVGDAENFEQLLWAHEAFADGQTAEIPDEEVPWRVLEADEVDGLFEREASSQLAHNQQRGILREAGDGQLRYSWRGLLYLYGQVLRQMLALG